MNFNLTVVIN